MAAVLLSFDFDYGDLFRWLGGWLGGEYTNQHRDWDALQRHFDIAHSHAQQPGYPVLEPEIAIKKFSRRCSFGRPFLLATESILKHGWSMIIIRH